MRFPNKEQIEMLRKAYPAGTKVELLAMEDKQAPPVGTIGEVMAVDDIGQLVMQWQNGSGLNLIPGMDSFRKVGETK